MLPRFRDYPDARFGSLLDLRVEELAWVLGMDLLDGLTVSVREVQP
jgi:hypothetical protein